MVDLRQGDCLEVLRTLPADSVHCCVTSPPFWGLRDYGVPGQLGLEPTPEEFVAKLVEVFREVRRVLRGDGTLWLNLGDSYAQTSNRQRNGAGASGLKADGRPEDARQKANGVQAGRAMYREASLPPGLKPKDLVGVPWRAAFALRADGWYLRQDIIWAKPNPMPESVRDRCTKAHEYLFLLAKSPRYFYDAEAIRERSVAKPQRRLTAVAQQPKGILRSQAGGQVPTCQGGTSAARNKRSVWTVTPNHYKGAHFATFPLKLVEPCVLAGSPPGGLVLDPFCGSGTVGAVCVEHGRNFVGIDSNGDYLELARRRVANAQPRLPGVGQ
jgi:DNA modification methylase